MIHELKLISIHKRNLLHLQKQKAQLGEFLPVYIQNQIDTNEESIAELETTLKRRLQMLLEKAALKGINTDPEISIEIEDIQAYFKENQK
jgi:hypothetical protein